MQEMFEVEDHGNDNEGHWSRTSYELMADRGSAEEMARDATLLRTARTLAVECPKCGAEPGRWCRTERGTTFEWLHVARLNSKLSARSSFDIPRLHPDDRRRRSS